MTAREQFESVLANWNDSVDLLNAAITDFMDDGLQTSGGTWILTMSQVKGEALHVAREHADVAKAALDRIIDDLQMLQGFQKPN